MESKEPRGCTLTKRLPPSLRPLFTTDYITKDELNTLVILRLLTSHEAWLIEFNVPF